MRIRIAAESKMRLFSVLPTSDEWWAWYSEYLRSPGWRARRDAVLARDGWICRACLRRSATEVHHTSYAHVGDEPLFELVAICQTCHDKITIADRNKRVRQAVVGARLAEAADELPVIHVPAPVMTREEEDRILEDANERLLARRAAGAR